MAKQLKILLIILGAVVLLAIAGIFWLKNQSQLTNIQTSSSPASSIDTSNRKTYQSDYGWSILYPPDWKVISLPSGEEVGFVSPQAEQAKKQCASNAEICTPFLIIETYDSLDGLRKSFSYDGRLSGQSLEELTKNLTQTNLNRSYTDADKFNLNGISAYFVSEGAQDKTVENTLIFVENSNFYYKINFRAVSTLTKLSGEENKILNSFQLITLKKLKIEEPKLTIKNWQDYNNQQLSFFLKIPDDWTISEESDKVLFTDPNQLKKYEWYQYTSSGIEQEIFSIKKFDSLKDYIDKAAGAHEESSYKNLETFLANSKNNFLSEYRKTNLFGLETYEIIWIGEGAYLGYTAIKDDKIYEVFFPNHSQSNQLTDVEKKILGSIKFD